MNTVFIIGIFIAFFLQFLLITKKNKTTQDNILAVWMFIIGLHLLSYYLYNLGYWDKHPHLIGIHHPFPLLHGPMLYLYVVFSLRPNQAFGWKDGLHFSPALICYLYLMPFYLLYNEEQKRMVNNGEINDYELFMTLSVIVFVISGLTYAFVSFRAIGKFETVIHNSFSNDENISLNWLRYCILGLLIIFVTVMVLSLVENFFDLEMRELHSIIYYSEIIVFVFLLGFFGIRHEGIFTDNKAPSVVVDLDADNKLSAYKNSGLKPAEAELLNMRLTELMENKKLYLEPKLTILALATELNVSVNYLSQIINQYEGKSFYDFVNQYRVEEFKQLLKNPRNKHLNILALAYEAGFNSKSTFNMVFKKHSGITPSQYSAQNRT